MPPLGSSSSDGDAAEVFDFLDEYERDAERGRARGLREYLARYPGHEEAIAREYLRLQAASGEAAQGAAPESTPREQDERRIGPYRLLRELGAGGQGAVWLCEDTRIAREVALKFMPSSFALLSADRRRRMQREAEVVSRLQHPAICPVYEAQIEHDPPYIAMRYVEGDTLAAAISRARGGERAGPLPLPPRNGIELRRVLLFFERAARALHAAHEAGVIHRDIKPGNVMVTEGGEPVLLDFGQARDERAELDQRTLSGEVFGTPMYMSPEQVAGSASGVDRRTDVWSLGASLFEALTLARPFLGESVPAVLMAIRNEPLPPVRRMNAALEEDAAVVVETALEKDLRRRYASALEFAEDLRRVREYEPIRARAAGPWLRLRRWAQRQPALAASLSLASASLLSGLAWTLHLLEREQDAKDEALSALEERQVALDHALARHFAGRSAEWLEDDPALALALGLLADEITPGLYQTRAALLPALDACRLARQLDGGVNARLVLDTALFADSRRVAASLDDCSLQAWDLRSGAELWLVREPSWPAGFVRAHPSGAWVATTGEDGVLRRFEGAYGAPCGELAAVRGRAAALELDASGEQLAVLGADGELALVGADGGLRWRIQLARSDLGRLRFDPTGRRLVTASSGRGGAALVLDAADGRLLGEASTAPASLLDLDLSRDGERLLTADSQGRVQLWRLPDAAPLGDPLRHEARVNCARFSLDGRRVVAALDADERSHLVLWELDERKPRALHGRHAARIVALDVCEDGARFVSTSRDTRIQVWGFDGQAQASFNAWSQPLETRWTADGQRLVTRGVAYYLHVWWGEDPPDVYSLAGHEGAVRSVAFDDGGDVAISSGDDGVARLWITPQAWDARGSAPPGAQLAVLCTPGAAITHARFAPGGLALTLSENGEVTWWTVEREPHSFSERIPGRPLAAAVGGGGSRDPTVAAVLSSHGSVHVLHVGGCASIPAEEVDRLATACALDESGRFLAVGRSDATVRVHDLLEQTLVAEHRWTPRGGAAAAVAVALRPDARQLAVACGDARVRFFERTGGELTSLSFSAFPLRDVVYNSSATRLLATGPNGRAAMRLIDLARLQGDKSIRHEVYHAGNITSGCFDRSGRFVLTTSEDGSALVRESGEGERVVRFDRHGAPVLCGAFSRDEGALRVISGAANGVIRVWPVDPAPAARARKPREMREWEHAREARLASPLPYPALR